MTDRPYRLALSRGEVQALIDFHLHQQEEARSADMDCHGDADRVVELRQVLVPSGEPRGPWPFARSAPAVESTPAVEITVREPDGAELASWRRDARGRLVEDDGEPS
jgi:hypothetical protein